MSLSPHGSCRSAPLCTPVCSRRGKLRSSHLAQGQAIGVAIIKPPPRAVDSLAVFAKPGAHPLECFDLRGVDGSVGARTPIEEEIPENRPASINRNQIGFFQQQEFGVIHDVRMESIHRKRGSPMDSGRFRVGIAGCGMISNWHADAIRSIEGAVLVAAADTSRAGAEGFARKYGVPAFDSYERMLKEEDVDVVCICTPQQPSCSLCRDGRECGDHFFRTILEEWHHPCLVRPTRTTLRTARTHP